MNKCVQESQDSADANMPMSSRIYFKIRTDSLPEVEDYCDVRQTNGPRHNSSQIDVSPPHSYKGPYDHQAFTHGIAAYYAMFLADKKETVRAKTSFEMTHEFTFVSQETAHT